MSRRCWRLFELGRNEGLPPNDPRRKGFPRDPWRLPDAFRDKNVLRQPSPRFFGSHNFYLSDWGYLPVLQAEAL